MLMQLSQMLSDFDPKPFASVDRRKSGTGHAFVKAGVLDR
jgi:hypothetical protein